MDRHEIARTSEVTEGKGKLVRVRGVEIGVFRVGTEFRAYRNVCPHAAAPVCAGPVTGAILRCPWHGWEFDLRTGEFLSNPACKLQGYPVEVEGDRLFVLA